MRPRTIGKIVTAVLTAIFLLLALYSAVQAGEQAEGYRAITYAIMSLTSATLYRYFED